MKVLFICSGNICRSPMAAEYMRHRAAHSGLAHLVVDSAGTLGIHGAPASEDAIRTLGEMGLDLGGHRSKGLSPDDLMSSDWVIGMALEHLDHVSVVYPGCGGQRWLLRAFEKASRPERGAPDLDDPIGAPIEVYREQFGRIRTCIDHLVLHLRHADPGPIDD